MIPNYRLLPSCVFPLTFYVLRLTAGDAWRGCLPSPLLRLTSYLFRLPSHAFLNAD